MRYRSPANPMRRPLLLGIDVGTTGVRAALFDPVAGSSGGAAVKVADAAELVGHETPHAGWAEADPEAWWRAVGVVLERIGAESLQRVAGVGVCGQAPTAVLVDAEGRSLGPAILWLDTRA